jgi:hypothetical protein
MTRSSDPGNTSKHQTEERYAMTAAALERSLPPGLFRRDVAQRALRRQTERVSSRRRVSGMCASRQAARSPPGRAPRRLQCRPWVQAADASLTRSAAPCSPADNAPRRAASLPTAPRQQRAAGPPRTHQTKAA